MEGGTGGRPGGRSQKEAWWSVWVWSLEFESSALLQVGPWAGQEEGSLSRLMLHTETLLGGNSVWAPAERLCPCCLSLQAAVSAPIPHLTCFHRRPGKSRISSANSPVGFFSLQLGNLQAMAPLHQPPWGLACSSLAVSTEARMPSFTGLRKAVACSLQGPSGNLWFLFSLWFIQTWVWTHTSSQL